MAFRKKPAEPIKNNPDDVQKAQEIITGGAQAVTNAASKFFGKNPAGEIDELGRPIDEKWMEMKRLVTEADQNFKDEYMNNPFENVDVRVMQVGPDGRLTDVSNRIRPQDIRPEQIADFRSEGVNIPRGRDGRIDKEAAMDLLSQILRAEPRTGSSTTEAIRKMEIALEASDKILEHWKK